MQMIGQTKCATIHFEAAVFLDVLDDFINAKRIICKSPKLSWSCQIPQLHSARVLALASVHLQTYFMLPDLWSMNGH